MRRIEKLAQYIFFLLCMMTGLAIANLIILSIMAHNTDSSLAYVPVDRIAKHLERTKEGQFAMSEEGIGLIGKYDGFAMLIGNSGELLWEYRLPKELDKTYSMSDVASFTRWYLQDYPVYVYILEDGIFVAGRQKGTVWKYTLVYSTETFAVQFVCLPLLFLADSLLLLIIPFVLLRRQNRRKERERTTWIAGVSHDIRTPLSLALGYADAIKNESMEGQTVQKATVIKEQAVRIRTLITNLNTENKLTYGMGKWHKEKLLMPALIRESMCEIMNREPGAQYELEVRISEELEQLYLVCDRELVKRMLENLVNNAIAHNPQGCHILVLLEQHNIWILNRYALTVSDDGRGVEKRQLKLFHSPLKMEKLSEHGLGIRLVRQISALHHWKVRFGNGSEGGFYCKIWMH